MPETTFSQNTGSRKCGTNVKCWRYGIPESRLLGVIKKKLNVFFR